MVRSFKPDPIPRKTLLELLDAARRAPSAGYAQGVSFLVIDELENVSRFWDISLPKDRREGFPWQKLLLAPVIVLPVAEPDLYFRRYGEADKRPSDLSNLPDLSNLEGWKVPYWLVDGAFAVENLLLLAHSLELGALFFGLFSREDAIKSAFQIPEENKLLGAVALGQPDWEGERASASLKRGRRSQAEVIRFNFW